MGFYAVEELQSQIMERDKAIADLNEQLQKEIFGLTGSAPSFVLITRDSIQSLVFVLQASEFIQTLALKGYRMCWNL